MASNRRIFYFCLVICFVFVLDNPCWCSHTSDEKEDDSKEKHGDKEHDHKESVSSAFVGSSNDEHRHSHHHAHDAQKDSLFSLFGLDSSEEHGFIHRFKKRAKDFGIDLDVGFVHAFIASLAVIIVSELGDKTFFIAAIMAMRHSRLTVFMGAIGALGAMTVLSALMGYATSIIPRTLTFYASSALFAIFGMKMLKEGWTMSPDEGQEEYEEVQADLKKRDDERIKASMGIQDVETGIIRTPSRRWFRGILSTIFLQSLTLTFLAEWGDRSQIATIILAARAQTEDIIGVILGGTLGHAFCTGLAVIGGRFIAQRISIRTVTLIGGSVFILFALSAFVIGP